MRQKNRGRRGFSLFILVLIMAMCIVTGISALRHSSGKIKYEKEISMEEIDRILAELPEEKREIFRQSCIQKIREVGYLPYDATLEEIISYTGHVAVDVGMEYKSLRVIAVSDNSVLVKNEEAEVERFAWDVYDTAGKKVNVEQLTPGDRIEVLGTREKLLLLNQREESKLSLDAVWIVASDSKSITFKYKEQNIKLPNATDGYRSYEDIADLLIEKEGITDVKVYNDKLNAKLLSINDGKIELEGVGSFPYTEDIQVYKLFGEQKQYTLSDLKIGYEFTDFVRNENGEIVAALVKEEGYLDKIRVLVKTTGFASAYHEDITFLCDTDMEWRSGDKNGIIAAGDEISIDKNSDYFRENRIVFKPLALSAKTSISSISRSQGIPSYRGNIEIERCTEGLLLINELPLDEYLYCVVPSEMPSSYPLEALKAQAVSARTYAYTHMNTSRLQSYGAHVDDSAAFQVYNNIVENDSTTRAVRETEGVIVCEDGNPVTTYFYSTSCGYGTDLTAWAVKNDSYLKAGKIGWNESKNTTADTDFTTFIKNKDTTCYEAEEAYYRWKYETDLDERLLTETLQKRYEANPHQILTLTKDGFVQKEIEDIGKIQAMEVLKRAEGGAVTELRIDAQRATIKVISEKNVRYVLANESTSLRLGDNYTKEGAVNGMLPSAFLVIEPVYSAGAESDEIKEAGVKEIDRDNAGTITGYTIWGGGFGHGIGMSQNGAKQMALRGKNYRDILQFFYTGTSLENLKENNNFYREE